MSSGAVTRRVVLGIGSNQGTLMENLQGAVDALFDAPGLELVALSPVYQSTPVGGPPQDDYLNAVLVADTTLDADSLLERAQSVEEAFGRVREARWGPRSIDVDIIVLDEEQRSDKNLTLPHPRAHERAFVLRPWADVDPEAKLAGRGRVADLLADLPAQELHRRNDLVLQEPG